MPIELAVQILKVCLALQSLSQFIIDKVRAKQNAADLLIINKACGLYVEANDVGEKINEAEKIRNKFRRQSSDNTTSGDGTT